jgi:hypothetical protein
VPRALCVPLCVASFSLELFALLHTNLLVSPLNLPFSCSHTLELALISHLNLLFSPLHMPSSPACALSEHAVRGGLTHTQSEQQRVSKQEETDQGARKGE